MNNKYIVIKVLTIRPDFDPCAISAMVYNSGVMVDEFFGYIPSSNEKVKNISKHILHNESYTRDNVDKMMHDFVLFFDKYKNFPVVTHGGDNKEAYFFNSLIKHGHISDMDFRVNKWINIEAFPEIGQNIWDYVMATSISEISLRPAISNHPSTICYYIHAAYDHLIKKYNSKLRK